MLVAYPNDRGAVAKAARRPRSTSIARFVSPRLIICVLASWAIIQLAASPVAPDIQRQYIDAATQSVGRLIESISPEQWRMRFGR
jgi:hypothetical protein